MPEAKTESEALLTPALAVSESDAIALTTAPLEESFLEKMWANYLILLEEKPILVKSCTSLFGFLIGDICAQLIIGADYDVYRTLRMTFFGILMDGPIGHCWYLTLDRNVMPETPTVPKAVIIKTLLDQLVWAPFFSCVFFTFNQTLQGHPELSLSTIQSTLIPTLTANWALWPLAHLINFKFVPSNQRILYINFVQILWTSYLSNLAARHNHLVSKMHEQVIHPVAAPLLRHTHEHILHHAHHTDIFHSLASKFLH